MKQTHQSARVRSAPAAMGGTSPLPRAYKGEDGRRLQEPPALEEGDDPRSHGLRGRGGGGGQGDGGRDPAPKGGRFGALARRRGLPRHVREGRGGGTGPGRGQAGRSPASAHVRTVPRLDPTERPPGPPRGSGKPESRDRGSPVEPDGRDDALNGAGTP